MQKDKAKKPSDAKVRRIPFDEVKDIPMIDPLLPLPKKDRKPKKPSK